MVATLSLPRAVEQYEIARLEQHLADEARLVRRLAQPLLAAPQPDRLQALTRQVGSEVGARVTIIDGRGRVLADSLHDPATMENHANRRRSGRLADGTGAELALQPHAPHGAALCGGTRLGGMRRRAVSHQPSAIGCRGRH